MSELNSVLGHCPRDTELPIQIMPLVDRVPVFGLHNWDVIHPIPSSHPAGNDSGVRSSSRVLSGRVVVLSKPFIINTNSNGNASCRW